MAYIAQSVPRATKRVIHGYRGLLVVIGGCRGLYMVIEGYWWL